MNYGYLRKSTESDERQVQSIEDQKQWIESNIQGDITYFSESKSAKDPYVRTEFEEMMKLIKKQKGCKIYCWKLDRLSRNPVDSGILQYLMQTGCVESIVTSDREYGLVDSGLLMSIENAMSNQFIIDLRKNVERGMQSKLKKGGCVGKAPLGYINNKETNEVAIDEDYSPYIKQIFNLKADGMSLNGIADELYEVGARSKKGKKITSSTIDQIIKNPFYIGLQRFRGELHDSIHERLIDPDVWEFVNGIKKGYKKHTEAEFPLKGWIKGKESGKPLLAQFKKNKYVYYSSGKTHVENINISEGKIVEYFDSVIEQYKVSPNSTNALRSEIKAVFEEQFDNIKEERAKLIKDIKNLEKKTDRIFDLLMSGTIADEKYKSERNTMMISKKQIEKRLADLQDFDTIVLSEASRTTELLCNISLQWNNADWTKKSYIIKFLTTELLIDDKKRLYVAEEPLYECIRILNGFKWQGVEDNSRTIKALARYILNNSKSINRKYDLHLGLIKV